MTRSNRHTIVPRVFSGVQPTGELHIGNYLGALRQWVEMAKTGDHESVYAIVDAHATTVDYSPREMRSRIFDAALTCIAAGLDSNVCTLFVQSDVPEHLELAWYLATVTPMGDLHRMTQFKEKSDEHKQNVNAGLFTYPILMAADILLYRATVVPVGNDQVQHLELAREICRRFNARFGEVFVEPKPHLGSAPRIMGLDGKVKMSKSRGNTIGLFETPEGLERKLRGAFTDPGKLRRNDPGHPEICNIFTMQKATASPEASAAIERECRSGALGCGECKQQLARRLLSELAPIREKAAELRANPERVLGILRDGACHARTLARQTMADVRESMGLGSAVST